MKRSGPLSGVRIVELASIGPGPFCGMLLADLGAEVVVIDRPQGAYALYGLDPKKDFMNRGKRSVVLDLKKPEDVQKALDLIARADGVIEGSRPGVAERLGVGPEVCLARNPALVYGRITGWGQTGPWAQWAGHDIDYIAISGALHMCGRPGEPPAIPMNFVGDMGGGGMLLAFGMAAALFEARGSGKGQVVDAAMIEGAAAQMAGMLVVRANGQIGDERGDNTSCGVAPFYDTYQTADGKYLAVGAIEPQFYRAFLQGMGLDADPEFGEQWARERWPALKAKIAARLREKNRDAWMAIFSSEACVAPVLSPAEVEYHPQNAARGTYFREGDVLQPGTAPRFSRTPGAVAAPPPERGADTEAVFREWLGA